MEQMTTKEMLLWLCRNDKALYKECCQQILGELTTKNNAGFQLNTKAACGFIDSISTIYDINSIAQ